jgi:AraC family transcriptional regulator, regulatory protein of adaptative response / methylated-DNA-[protein]-cysteine methyltransferase
MQEVTMIEIEDRELTIDEEIGWQAVIARDSRFDGAFVIGVRTTGIYCRPSCPARKPHRENVVFFSTSDMAREEGFRPCLRCHPDDVAPQLRMVEQACRYIEERADQTITLSELGEAVGVSPHHLQRTFKRVMGISPRAYADQRRMGTFKLQVKGQDDVTSAMYDAGFGSSSRLYERAPAQLGMTPGTYRRGGKGMQIDYTIVDSPLGRLLVAATERGVCAVYLGDVDTELEASLLKEYPAAEIQRDGAGLGSWVGAIVEHLRGQQPHLDLPLDLQATAFQRRVWETLRAIPYGTTRTYTEIAHILGQPTATRAVARACATNPVSIVVPCHRVVRGDGSLAGYRWGIDRKQALLEQERTLAAQGNLHP